MKIYQIEKPHSAPKMKKLGEEIDKKRRKNDGNFVICAIGIAVIAILIITIFTMAVTNV